MIEGVVGLMGQGKTLYTTAKALQAIKQGTSVYANYEIRGAYCIDDMTQLLQASLPVIGPDKRPVRDPKTGLIPQKLIIIDEANLTCPSRYWNKLDPRVLYYWSQSRKLGLTIIWTAQHEKRVDTALKEITYRIWHSNHLGKLHWYSARLPEESGKKKFTNMGHSFLFRTKSLCQSYDTLRLIGLSADVISVDGPDWRSPPTLIEVAAPPPILIKKRRLGRRA